MRWRSALLVVSSVVLAAGCGSSAREPRAKPPPRIPAAVAQQLASDADAVASAQGCAARAPAQQLLRDVIAASRRMPPRYQEPLTSAANDLYARIPACPPPQSPGKGEKPRHEKREKKHGHGHKKHGGHDD